MTGTTDALRKVAAPPTQHDWTKHMEQEAYNRACEEWLDQVIAYTAPPNPDEAPMAVDAPTLPHFADLRDGGNLHKPPRDWRGDVIKLAVLGLILAFVWWV